MIHLTFLNISVQNISVQNYVHKHKFQTSTLHGPTLVYIMYCSICSCAGKQSPGNCSLLALMRLCSYAQLSVRLTDPDFLARFIIYMAFIVMVTRLCVYYRINLFIEHMPLLGI